jgi:hypothetical protein
MSMWRAGREAVRIGDPVLTPLDRSVAETRAADWTGATGPDGADRTGAAERTGVMAGRAGGPLGDIVDTVAKWIPGDVLALYVAGVTLIGSPNWFWLVVGILLAPAVVVLAAFANSGGFPPDVRTVVRAGLGFVAMLVWSLTVPVSGWHSWGLVRDNAAAVALAAAAVGLIFGLVAEGVSRWADNRPPAPAPRTGDNAPLGDAAAPREPAGAPETRPAEPAGWASAGAPDTRGDRTERAEPADQPLTDESTAELPTRRWVDPQPLRMPSIPPLD